MDTLTYYGHATLGLSLGESSLVIDPFFTNNPQAPIKQEDVKADYILVSHGHYDHLGDAEAIARRNDALVIAGGTISKWLKEKGIRTQFLQIGGGAKFPFGYLKFTQAIHGNSMPDGTPAGLPCGFLITPASGKKIYIAGDTALFGDMKLIGEEEVDTAVLPIGDYYTMGPADALRAVKMLQPRQVIPYHYNTFDVIQQDPMEWKRVVEAETGVKVSVLNPGEKIDL